MSKFRPSDKNCLFVIPDLHGAIDLLDQILARILPLRKSDGGKDRLIFLGDYIDRHTSSHLVIDRLIQLKEKYGEQVICLKGNHEEMFLKTMNLDPAQNLNSAGMTTNHKMWINNGGDQTLAGYLERAGVEADPYNFERYRIEDIIPKEHIKFLQEELVYYYEFENYLFVHAGCNPQEPISKHDKEVLLWDRSLYSFCVRSVNFNDPLDWEKTVVAGHNVNGEKKPFIHEKFMMLDCGSPKQLLVVELQSMQAYMAYPNQERLVAYELKETEAKPGSFKRVT